MTNTRVLAGLVVAFCMLASGCGDDTDEVGTGGPTTLAPGAPDTTQPGGSGSPTDDLTGRTFLSTSVTVDGVDTPLVDGSQISLTFEADNISVSAGCNQMGGTVTLDDGVLTADALSMTMMGCDEPLMAQDTLVADFFRSGPTWSIDGDTLVLTGDDGRVVTLDREVADPDRDLVGPVWSVGAIIVGDTAGLPVTTPGTMEFGNDGTVSVFDGCNTGGGSYTIEDDHVTFGPIAMTEMACSGDGVAMMVDAVRMVLAYPDLTFSIEADRLSLRGADDSGIDLRADR